MWVLSVFIYVFVCSVCELVHVTMVSFIDMQRLDDKVNEQPETSLVKESTQGRRDN